MLVRHGKPACSNRGWLSGEGFARWLTGYDQSGIAPAEVPALTRRRAAQAGCVIASDLLRAVETARALAPDLELVSDPLFREVELPVLPRAGSRLRLSPDLWAVLLRCAGLCLRLIGNPEARATHARLRERVERAALELVRRAGSGSPVLLVGHGMINFLIARELRSLGWTGPRFPGTGYWATSLYRWEG